MCQPLLSKAFLVALCILASTLNAIAVVAVDTGRQDFIVPNDAHILNVKEAPYNAKGDGVTDDTAALQKALDTASRLIYLPDGVYRISQTLR